MGFLKNIGGFIKNKVWNQYIKPFPGRLYNNIKDNWHYASRIPGDSWRARIVRGGFVVGGILAGVSAATFTSGHASLISSAGCLYHSTRGYSVQQMCSMEACRRMNPPVCQQSFANQPPPPVFSNQSSPPKTDNNAKKNPTITPKPDPTHTPTYIPEPYDRCDLFADVEISYVFFDLENCNSKLTVSFDFPGGVPGLEADAPDDDGQFDYQAELGNVLSESCEYLQYENHLFCDFQLPSGYADSLRTLKLYINRCEDTSGFLKPIFIDESASVPVQKGCNGSSGRSSGGSSSPTCTSGATINVSESQCTALGGIWDTTALNCYCP